MRLLHVVILVWVMQEFFVHWRGAKLLVLPMTFELTQFARVVLTGTIINIFVEILPICIFLRVKLFFLKFVLIDYFVHEGDIINSLVDHLLGVVENKLIR